MSESIATKLTIAIVCLVIITMGAVGVYWSKEPATFNVSDESVVVSSRLGRPVVSGSATTATIIHIIETLFSKRGGYLANDVLPPGLLMDNMPQWEYGVILQLRDSVRVMNDRLSKVRPGSAEDEDMVLAKTRLGIEHTSWIMPDAESEYEESIEYLQNYLKRLADVEEPDAQFNTSTENLDYWLEKVQVRLGNLSGRLSASVDNTHVNIGADKNSAGEYENTPRMEIDNVYYQARGSSWALIHLLKAMEIDFAEVLKDKNARLKIAQIIHELEATQQPGSPVVLNGDRFGLLANHSLVMALYISRAQVGVVELRELLKND